MRYGNFERCGLIPTPHEKHHPEERLRRVDALAEARTPLTAIQGFVELLAGHEHDEPRRQEYLRLVLSQCENLARTLDELFATVDQPGATDERQSDG